jgi:hypothetical protein
MAYSTNTNDINSVSLRGVERLRGKAEANQEIPRSARNKLRNPKQRRGNSWDCRALWARNDSNDNYFVCISK